MDGTIIIKKNYCKFLSTELFQFKKLTIYSFGKQIYDFLLKKFFEDVGIWIWLKGINLYFDSFHGSIHMSIYDPLIKLLLSTNSK